MRYIVFIKLCTNDRAMISLFERLSTEACTRKPTGILHVHCSVLYSAEGDGVEWMVGAAVYFIKIPPRATAPWSFLVFCCKIFLAGLGKAYTAFAIEVHLSFLYFMSIRSKASQTPPKLSNRSFSATYASSIMALGIRISAGSTIVMSMKSALSHEGEYGLGPRLSILLPCCLPQLICGQRGPISAFFKGQGEDMAFITVFC